MTIALSIIIPTIGRPTLTQTLDSILPQLIGGDEVLVVGDGPQPEAHEIARSKLVTYMETEPTRCWGHAQRNLGMSAAQGEYLAFMDDDDIYLPNALFMVRAAIKEVPGKPLIFRMSHLGKILWKTPKIAIDNVSTQMYVFPNLPHRLASWKPNPGVASLRGGDFLFARDTATLWGPKDVIFRKEVIARLTVHADGKR